MAPLQIKRPTQQQNDLVSLLGNRGGFLGTYGTLPLARPHINRVYSVLEQWGRVPKHIKEMRGKSPAHRTA